MNSKNNQFLLMLNDVNFFKVAQRVFVTNKSMKKKKKKNIQTKIGLNVWFGFHSPLHHLIYNSKLRLWPNTGKFLIARLWNFWMIDLRIERWNDLNSCGNCRAFHACFTQLHLDILCVKVENKKENMFGFAHIWLIKFCCVCK